MLYSNKVHLFSRFLGLALALPVYALLFSISQSLLNRALKESMHTKNYGNRYQLWGHLAQVYQPVYRLGSSIGALLDTLLCGLLQPVFYVSHLALGEEKTNSFVERVSSTMTKADASAKPAIQSSLNEFHQIVKVTSLFYVPVWLFLKWSDTSLLAGASSSMAAAIGATTNFLMWCGLDSVRIDFQFGDKAMLKDSRFNSQYISQLNDKHRFPEHLEKLNHQLYYPGDYSKENYKQLVDNWVSEAESQNAYVDDHLVLPQQNPKKTSKLDKKIKENSSFKQGYDIARGYLAGLDKSQNDFLENACYQSGGRTSKEGVKPKSLAGGTYSFLKFYQHKKNHVPLTKEKMVQKRDEYFTHKFSSSGS